MLQVEVISQFFRARPDLLVGFGAAIARFTTMWLDRHEFAQKAD